jgi:hypothetical protein
MSEHQVQIERVFVDPSRRFRGGVVDWRIVIEGLASAGVSGAALATAFRVSRGTVDNWKHGRGEPSYSVGARMLAWWDRSKMATAALAVARARSAAERQGH